ncbi:hypothetical protein S83_014406 [Arachis hypogaea]
MSKETVTDPTLSPVDLTEEPMSNLINIFRTHEQSADFDLLEAELLRREGLWEARSEKAAEELFQLHAKNVDLMVKLKQMEDQLEEEKNARRRDEKLLRRTLRHYDGAGRRLYDKATEMMAESSNWRLLANSVVDVLTAKEKSLSRQAGDRPEQGEDSDGGI